MEIGRRPEAFILWSKKVIVKILKEAGHEEALLGMSLSFYDHAIPLDEFWTDEKYERAFSRSRKLAFMQGGHNKFLESIQMWIFIQASRDFWQEFDTYRVGMTKQSSSTMHTLDKREVVLNDFEAGTCVSSIRFFNEALSMYKDNKSEIYKDVSALKKNLPEGWLQERIVCTNYKVLQNIIWQREKHRLVQWKQFCKDILDQCQHPYYLKEKK